MPVYLEGGTLAKSFATKARRAKRRHEKNPHGAIANPELAKGMAAIARSGAAGSHQDGVRGQRTRKGAKNAAIRDASDE